MGFVVFVLKSGTFLITVPCNKCRNFSTESKMFYYKQAVTVTDLHRDYLRFMWYENMENSNLLIIYRFTRIVFGLTCSPFILNATGKAHLQNYIIAKTIRILAQFLCDMYVDNTAASFNLSFEALAL